MEKEKWQFKQRKARETQRHTNRGRKKRKGKEVNGQKRAYSVNLNQHKVIVVLQVDTVFAVETGDGIAAGLNHTIAVDLIVIPDGRADGKLKE